MPATPTAATQPPPEDDRQSSSVSRRRSCSRLGILLAVAALALGAAMVDTQHYIVTKLLPNPPVGCPKRAFTVVVFGQSQATNTGERRRIGPPGSYFFAAGRCYRLRDPVAGASNGGGSIWPSFAAALDRPVVIVNGAVDGLSIEQLSGEPLRRLLANVDGLRSRGLVPDLTIFMQGETDAAARTPERTYFDALLGLRRALPGRWLITQESICDIPRPDPALAAARHKLAALDPLVMIGPDLDRLGPTYRREDGCHFNRRGQDEIARQLAASISPTFARKHSSVAD